MKIVLATTNKHKYDEFLSITGNTDLIYSPEVVIEETGKTYRENSMLKAIAWAEKTGCACLADDSGLEVDALSGAPGIFSARVSNNPVSWLLQELDGIMNRKARFVASLALCLPDKTIIITEGSCSGTIATSPRGTNGFGYDPVFIPDGYNHTFAELSASVKNQISHRYNAYNKLKHYI